ncbi:hypothetical protein A2368_00410 [Candidatus Collierbacteria bacterium RIFOXYB1_FULL_49_13]|uniref:Uncharacterized protein n=1 Tax=Candidatus Collierbacteria bacterium RIFOXYB1_FULL_49_13 TaxID=1817728 RepID=A0A1F5FGR7_9BACT|nr:MAG: hypothetical protein A2368_00410 [Candidatus Collierbacteria bacterium RIFOXYB1_FULL_49_13]
MPVSVKHREQEVSPDKEGVARGDGFVVIPTQNGITISDGRGWSVTVNGNEAAVYTDKGEIKIKKDD